MSNDAPGRSQGPRPGPPSITIGFVRLFVRSSTGNIICIHIHQLPMMHRVSDGKYWEEADIVLAGVSRTSKTPTVHLSGQSRLQDRPYILD